MGSTPTTISSLTPDQFAARLAATFPAGWCAPEAKMPGGVVYDVLNTAGSQLSFEITAFQYALAATRVQNAVNGALDLASLDYFGTLPPYALPRLPGELDPSFRARILAGLGNLGQGATRAAITAAVEAVAQQPIRITEGWSPADTGVIDGGAGEGMMFWDVDTAATPGRITDWLPYQGFVQCAIPVSEPFGNNPTPCYDEWTMNYDVAGSSFIDPTPTTEIGEQAVYNAINKVKCEGTIVWVQFVPPTPTQTWDGPGQTWDQAGALWPL